MSESFLDQNSTSVWQSNAYSLDCNQANRLIDNLQPGAALRTINAVKNGNPITSEMLPQLMVFAVKPSAVWYPLDLARGKVKPDPEIALKRQRFVEELKKLDSLLTENGIANMDHIPHDKSSARLLALGIITAEAIREVQGLETDNFISETPPYGKGRAILYKSGRQITEEILRLNEKPITDTAALLDAVVFLIQINEEPSSYEVTRNRNVASLMLGSLNGGNLTLDRLRQTNIDVMQGIGQGGVYRDFEHIIMRSGKPPAPTEIPSRLAVWLNDAKSLLDAKLADSELEIARLAAEYNEIHPWRNGNGRSATIEVNRLRSLLGLRPIFIPQDKNVEYILALNNPIKEENIRKLAQFYKNYEMPREEFVQAMQKIIAIPIKILLYKNSV